MLIKEKWLLDRRRFGDQRAYEDFVKYTVCVVRMRLLRVYKLRQYGKPSNAQRKYRENAGQLVKLVDQNFSKQDLLPGWKRKIGELGK